MWFVVFGIAQAATWTWRAPVPTQPLADGEPLQVCLRLPADLGIEQVTTTVGNTTLECTTEGPDDQRSTHMCYTVAPTDWPTDWPSVSCAGPKTTVELKLVPAYDPADDLTDGVSIFAGIDEVMAFFTVGGEWPNQESEGRRGTDCKITDGRFVVSRDGPGRRNDTCAMRRRDGSIVQVDIRFTGRAP